MLSKMIACHCLLLAITLPAQAEDEELTRLLDNIDTALASINALAGSDAPRYSLAHESEFPCSVTVTEISETTGAAWQKRYRFELSDIQPGTLFRAQDTRRAITYYGTRTAADGSVKAYAPKRINGFSMNTADTTPPALATQVNRAIAICRERNNF